MRHGYACINMTLAKKKVVVNRGMIKRTFSEKGIAHASQLALMNVTDLEKILRWNIRHNILFYRMSSDMFPWMSEYTIADLPDYKDIQRVLARCGQKIRDGNMRVSYHPGPFNVLAAKNPLVIAKTNKELSQHAEIMDLMELPQTPFSKINIHIGGAYGDKEAALSRWAEHYAQLPEPTRNRLTIENDDKAGLFSVKDLLWLHEQVGVPIVFDYFHHTFCTGGLSEQEALEAALSTWPQHILPAVHFSSSRKEFEDSAALPTAHADYVYAEVNHYGRFFDVMFEAKAKELAVEQYERKWPNSPYNGSAKRQTG